LIKYVKLNAPSFHDEPCKIGQPPSSLFTTSSNARSPSVAKAASLTHEAYKRRALITA
ncbi:unnamed protein product, partial [Rotaria socialis]